MIWPQIRCPGYHTIHIDATLHRMPFILTLSPTNLVSALQSLCFQASLAYLLQRAALERTLNVVPAVSSVVSREGRDVPPFETCLQSPACSSSGSTFFGVLQQPVLVVSGKFAGEECWKRWAFTSLFRHCQQVCSLSRILISVSQSRTDGVIELDGPVIKKESYYTPTPATCEYAGKSTYAREAHRFHQARPQPQPTDGLLEQADMAPLYRSPSGHSGDSSPLYLARASPGDRHVTAPAPSYLTVMPTRAMAEGFHLASQQPASTSTNGRRDPRDFEGRGRDQISERANQPRLLRLNNRVRNPSVAQAPATQPEISSIVRHQQLEETHDSATYEALRHSSAGTYQTSVAAFAPFHQDPHFYPYPAAMSLSYETRTFPDYPQSAMMHDPHQEQDDNSIQHHRYPSPPPPLSENPYNPQPIDAATALAMDDMPELPPKEDEDAPSPRSKPIPKPDREVTKGEDGRFVCNWTGCTEEMRSFNRKCEWSKVCAQVLTNVYGRTNSSSSTWTSTIAPTSAQQKGARNCQASRTLVVC